MPAFKNDNGDVVTATGVNAARLDNLDNWHRVKAAPEVVPEVVPEIVPESVPLVPPTL